MLNIGLLKDIISLMLIDHLPSVHFTNEISIDAYKIPQMSGDFLRRFTLYVGLYAFRHSELYASRTVISLRLVYYLCCLTRPVILLSATSRAYTINRAIYHSC